MINTNDQAQNACGTIPVATGVNIIEEQTSAAGDAHGVPTADTVRNHDHADESATPSVANTVNIIAPAPPVEAENASQQALLSIIQTLQNIRDTLVEQQARNHERAVFREKLKGFSQYFYGQSKIATLVAYGLLVEAINTTYAACGAAILRHHSKDYQVPEAVLATMIGTGIMLPAVIYAERCYALAENPSSQWQYTQTAMHVISCVTPPVIGYAVLQSIQDATMQLSQHIAAYELGFTILCLPVSVLLMGVSTICYKDYFSMEQAPNNAELHIAEAGNQSNPPVTSGTLMPSNAWVDPESLLAVQAERVVELHSANP